LNIEFSCATERVSIIEPMTAGSLMQVNIGR